VAASHGNVSPVTGRWSRWRWCAPAAGALAGLLVVLAAGCTSGGAPVDAGAVVAAATSGPAMPRPSATPSVAPALAAGVYHYVFPIEGNASYAHVHHDYPASDIFAACGRPVHAVTDGIVLEVNRVDRWDARTNLGPDRGGLSVSILGDDGVRYYGSHFSSITDGLDAGSRVAAGDVIGRVGRTGDASACHLHFGISPPCARTGDWAVRRGAIWPWPYLDSWRSGHNRSPVIEVATWLANHGCS
jgi:peptidoglycan LD-endopeptidase LytH